MCSLMSIFHLCIFFKWSRPGIKENSDNSCSFIHRTEKITSHLCMSLSSKSRNFKWGVTYSQEFYPFYSASRNTFFCLSPLFRFQKHFSTLYTEKYMQVVGWVLILDTSKISSKLEVLVWYEPQDIDR